MDVTYLLAALGALALYFLVILPWRHRHEDSRDLQRQARLTREDRPPVPPSPPPVVQDVPEHERVESVLSASERRALLGEDDEEPADEAAPPPWPTQASNPSDLAPVLALHTSDGSLATLLLLELQSEGIAYQDLGEVWASHRILVPRMHQNDARRILERLRRDAESRTQTGEDP